MAAYRKAGIVFVLFVFALVGVSYYVLKSTDDILKMEESEKIIVEKSDIDVVKKDVDTSADKVRRRPRYIINQQPLPEERTPDAWDAYYAKKYNFSVYRDEKTLKSFKRIQKTPEEVEKILARYDRKILEQRNALKEDPEDEKAKDELSDLIRSRSFAKTLANKFKELPPKEDL